jgi:CRISPR/Cas system-associated exonuclease Cas4 (RecB family)
MPPKTQSPTSINTYLRCPRKYFLRYIKGYKTKPSIHLITGLAVHQAIARFTVAHAADDLRSDDKQQVLLEMFDAGWQRQKGKLGRLQLSQGELADHYNASRQMLVTWLGRHPIGGIVRPEVEVRLFSRRHRLMGIVDAIFRQNGAVTLVDYKTGSKAEITRDIKIQMAIYVLLYKDNFGAAPHFVAVDFLKHSISRRFRVTEGLLQAAADICARIQEATQSTKEKDYPCRCGGWCEKDFIVENGPR